MKARASTKWHVQVLPAVKRQWYIRIKRNGEVVSVGETRKGKRSTIATAKGIVADMLPGKAVFDDLTRLSELPNGMWEF